MTIKLSFLTKLDTLFTGSVIMKASVMKKICMEESVLNLQDFHSGYRFIGYTPMVSKHKIYYNFFCHSQKKKFSGPRDIQCRIVKCHIS